MGKFVKVGTKAEFEDIEAGKLAEAGGAKHSHFQSGWHLLRDREYMSASGWTLG